MRTHLLRSCLLLPCFAITSLAHADDYCVDNTIELEEAISLATLGFTGDSVIRVRQGTYITDGVITQSPNNPIENDLTILGGYSDHKRRWMAKERHGHDVMIASGLLDRALVAGGVWPTGKYLRPA
jgi:hypothetical protein